jgi:large repetitive protein
MGGFGMARRSRGNVVSSLYDLLKTLFKGPKSAVGPARRRGFGFESLEGRAMLASDFGAIAGIIYRDFNNNGFTAGEQISGATVNLYTDDGDSVFEPGAGDALTGSTTTNASGQYRFEDLIAGSYWAQQPSQTIGGILLSAQNSNLLVISGLEAQGISGTTIDDFSVANPSVTAAFPPVGNISFAAGASASSLGGERDLLVELSAATGVGDQVTLAGTVGALTWNASLLAQGRYVDVWDGADGDGDAIAFTGLGSVDLTSGGVSDSFRMLIGTDQAGATARLRVYTNATNWSEQSIAIPNNPSNELIFKIADFTTGGAASGPANFSNVGAIEMQVGTTVDGTDGQVTFLGMLGPTVETQNFSNPADLSLTKIVNNANPTVGQNVTYTLTLSNAGPGAANNITVSDVLPAGMTFVSSTPSGTSTYNSGTGVWAIPSLNSGAVATLDITATVTTQGAKTNTGEVTDVDEFDPDSTPNNQNAGEDDQASVVLTATQVDLSLTKIVNNATPNVGGSVTFTVTASNGGPSNATGVVVTDLLPAGLTFVSATPSGSTTYVSGTGVWTIGNLNSAATAQLQIVATVATTGVKTNTAEVTAVNEGDSDSTPNNQLATEDDQASVTVTPQVADLSLTKTVNTAAPIQNQNVTFTLTVSNAGPNAGTNVAITDQLPAGLTFVSSTPSQGTYSSATGVWTVGTVNSAGSATLQIVATAATIGAKINSAQITAADQFDSDSTVNNNVPTEDDQASVTVTPQVADLSLTKTVNNATPNRNENVTFTITVSNAGPDAGTNVAITDQLPAGLTFVSSTPSQGTYSSATGVWTVGTVNSAGSATLQIVATAATIGAKINSAQITAADQFDGDSTVNNNVSTEDDQASVTVTPNSADLSITKQVNDASPDANQSVVFSVTLTNSGPQSATGVIVADQLPAGLTFVSSTPSGSTTYNSGTGVWTVGTLASGASATLQITATVVTAGAKTNTAQVSASDQFDVDSTPGNSLATEDDQASAVVTPNATDLSLTKTVNNAAPLPGANVSFTVTVTNNGPLAASGVTVSDQLPSGLTFVSSTPSGSTTYNSGTGVWNVGSLASGANATLTIVATAGTAGIFSNTAQVSAMNEFDTDSTPGNSVATEDDQASVNVTASQQVSPRLCVVVWRRTT